jgi:hypothetical protein
MVVRSFGRFVVLSFCRSVDEMVGETRESPGASNDSTIQRFNDSTIQRLND